MSNHLRVIISALLWPLIFWLITVAIISLSGTPGVVCATPLAWLLALPVGQRVGEESSGPRRWLFFEAAAAGGLLGFWQGLLFATVMTAFPTTLEDAFDIPGTLLVAGVAVILSVPVTACLSTVMAWLVARRRSLAA